MTRLWIGTPARAAFDRELARFIGAKKVTGTALARWSLANPHLAEQMDHLLGWFAGNEQLPGRTLAMFDPRMRQLRARLIVAVLTADPRGGWP